MRPAPDLDTQAYWDGCARGELLVPRCGSCARWIFQPSPVCPSCHAPDPVWTCVSGDGRIVSWTVIHPPVLPAWADDVPFTVLLVELDEGVRMIGRLVGGGEPAFDARVALAWRVDGDVTLPGWSLA